MSLFEVPALVFLITFALSLAPARRLSHYLVALTIASFCGLITTAFTLTVWGIMQ